MDPKSILRIVQDYEPTSIALRLAAQGLIPTPKHTHSAQDLPSSDQIDQIDQIDQTHWSNDQTTACIFCRCALPHSIACTACYVGFADWIKARVNFKQSGNNYFKHLAVFKLCQNKLLQIPFEPMGDTEAEEWPGFCCEGDEWDTLDFIGEICIEEEPNHTNCANLLLTALRSVGIDIYADIQYEGSIHQERIVAKPTTQPIAQVPTITNSLHPCLDPCCGRNQTLTNPHIRLSESLCTTCDLQFYPNKFLGCMFCRRPQRSSYACDLCRIGFGTWITNNVTINLVSSNMKKLVEAIMQMLSYKIIEDVPYGLVVDSKNMTKWPGFFVTPYRWTIPSVPKIQIQNGLSVQKMADLILKNLIENRIDIFSRVQYYPM